MSWPGSARPGCRSARSPRGWAAAPRPSAGSWPATVICGPAATSPSGRTGWPGSGSGAPSRPGCRSTRPYARRCSSCWTAATLPSRPPAGWPCSTRARQPCGSATSPSTSPSTSTRAAGCAASCRPACGPGGRSAAAAAAATPAHPSGKDVGGPVAVRGCQYQVGVYLFICTGLTGSRQQGVGKFVGGSEAALAASQLRLMTTQAHPAGLGDPGAGTPRGRGLSQRDRGRARATGRRPRAPGRQGPQAARPRPARHRDHDGRERRPGLPDRARRGHLVRDHRPRTSKRWPSGRAGRSTRLRNQRTKRIEDEEIFVPSFAPNKMPADVKRRHFGEELS
jgi:hypothetical protein